MKVFVVISVLLAIAAAAPSQEVELLEAFDFEALFKNDEMRQKSFDCMLGKADCGDLKPIKDAVIIVLKNKCADCNEVQKAKYDAVVKTVREKYESYYNDLQNIANSK